MTLRTRQPTGQVAYPLILVEGEEKAGKSVAAYTLSASPRVNRTFVFDLGEGTADEYAELGPYEIVEHNGTFSSLRDQLREATKVPAADDGRPNVIVLDDGTVLWDLLKDWASDRARRSTKARQILAKDPDAEIDVAMNYWNDAKDRWWEVVNLLRNWPGIAVILAKGKEVTRVENGAPTRDTEWKVEAEKGLAFACSAWVRMRRPHTATLVAARSLRVDVPAAGLPLPAEAPLEHLIFEVLGAGGGFAPSTRVEASIGTPKVAAMHRVLDAFKAGGLADDVAAEEARTLWGAAERGDELTTTELEALLADVGIRLVEIRRQAEAAA